MAQANVKLTVDASGATRALNGVQKQTNVLQKSFGGLRTALAGIGLIAVGRSAVKTSANFEKLNVRLGLLTKASGTFAKSQKIAADAQKAFGLSAIEALEGVTDITARLAPLKVGVEDIRTVFFGFNTAAKLAGASAMESSNAFRQLAQALGSGRLAGDEFRSVSEQVPTVLAPIAAELGVTIGELKQFAAEGKLTSDVVLRALGRVGNEGSGFLKELLKNDPTQVFKNFSNATEDLSRAFGDELRPAVEYVTKLLTDFISKTTEFVQSDAGQAAVLITKIAVALKLLAVAIPMATAAFTALLAKISMVGTVSLIAQHGLMGVKVTSLLAAGAITKTTLAVGAMKIAMAATGIGAFALLIGGVATALIGARREQENFNKAIKDGDKELLKSEFNRLFIERQKLLKRLSTAQLNNNKRGVASLKKQLAVTNESFLAIKEKLKTERETSAEIEKQNKLKKEQEEQLKKNQEEAEKLKEKMTAVGEEIESSIKSNLRDSITGAQSFGQAMTNVLNKIKNKIIDAQIDKLLGNFGESFGAKENKGGLGGFLGNIAGGLLGGLFADGGRPPVGKASIVGERGPELFVPKVAGTIIPNNAMGGGDNTTNIVNVSVDASGSSASGNSADAQQLGAVIGAAVQAQLIKEKRSGGLLAR